MNTLTDGQLLLAELVAEGMKRFRVEMEPVDCHRLPAMRVTVTVDIRQGRIDFFNHWPPETVQSNWDDLIQWVNSRP